MSRQARFDLNLRNQSTWVEGRHGPSFIDDLMFLLPGKDGYSAFYYDDSFGSVAVAAAAAAASVGVVLGLVGGARR
jgi:hypothetical protein